MRISGGRKPGSGGGGGGVTVGGSADAEWCWWKRAGRGEPQRLQNRATGGRGVRSAAHLTQKARGAGGGVGGGSDGTGAEPSNASSIAGRSAIVTPGCPALAPRGPSPPQYR